MDKASSSCDVHFGAYKRDFDKGIQRLMNDSDMSESESSVIDDSDEDPNYVPSDDEIQGERSSVVMKRMDFWKDVKRWVLQITTWIRPHEHYGAKKGMKRLQLNLQEIDAHRHIIL